MHGSGSRQALRHRRVTCSAPDWHIKRVNHVKCFHSLSAPELMPETDTAAGSATPTRSAPLAHACEVTARQISAPPTALLPPMLHFKSVPQNMNHEFCKVAKFVLKPRPPGRHFDGRVCGCVCVSVANAQGCSCACVGSAQCGRGARRRGVRAEGDQAESLKHSINNRSARENNVQPSVTARGARVGTRQADPVWRALCRARQASTCSRSRPPHVGCCDARNPWKGAQCIEPTSPTHARTHCPKRGHVTVLRLARHALHCSNSRALQALPSHLSEAHPFGLA
jgi:hypothetical protein